jgi:hypothetical protein
VPHPCGSFYEKEYPDFYSVTLPPIKTPEELRLLEEQRRTFWASHSHTVPNFNQSKHKKAVISVTEYYQSTTKDGFLL